MADRNEIDWDLSECCDFRDENDGGRTQVIFLVLAAVYLVVDFFLWNTIILKPMKLIAVMVHEMSHALACWLTGGQVKAIQVYNNEGGVTRYVGGWRLLVIPAGYLGGAFWGGAFVALSGNRVSSTVSAILFIGALAVSLCYSPNCVAATLSVTFITFTALCVFVEWFVFDPLLPFVTLYYGVFIGSFSVYDIYDDLITRTVEGSDAKACHELIPCCLPRCVGVQFAIIALTYQALGIYFALVWIHASARD